MQLPTKRVVLAILLTYLEAKKIKNTTVANYLIISGNFDSTNMDEEISYEFVSVLYDIEKELATNTDNIERESYEEELRCGIYRDMSSVYENFEERGIDVDKI